MKIENDAHMHNYFSLIDTLNWQVLWGKEKSLLNSLYVKLKNMVSLKHVKSKESFFPRPNEQI